MTFVRSSLPSAHAILLSYDICLLQAAQEARLLLLDRQARGMRAQIAAMKEGRILSVNSAFSPSDRYPTLTA